VLADIESKTWFADLVDDALHVYDPAAALLRWPPELRGVDPDGPDLEARARALLLRSLRREIRDAAVVRAEHAEAFLEPVEGDVGLALDIALVHGAPFQVERRRAELATLFAALTGDADDFRAADPARAGGGGPAAVRKALIHAGAKLKARRYPAGDPKEGLPLGIGMLCIQRRHVARLAIAYYGQALDLATVRKYQEQANEGTVLLVEALAAIASTSATFDARRQRISLAQVARLRLPRGRARQARVGLKEPRTTAELAAAAPARLRGFLLEQLLVSELASGGTSPASSAALEDFSRAAGITPEQRAALQAQAAALYADQQHWLDPTVGAPSDDWEALSDDWEHFADQMLDKVAAAITENLEAIVTEIKETGELGQLLAKAAAGHALTREERTKVKAQLIDLAKAVPALAIFAAPGGMLLLPLLAKLLPFNVLPSAWNDKDGHKKKTTTPVE
jgi:hypothetical protein